MSLRFPFFQKCLSPSAGQGQRGLSLLEAAITLSILGLIIAGLWLAVGTAIDNNKQRVLSQQLIQAVTNVRNHFKEVDNPSATSAQIEALGLYPDGLRLVGGSRRHGYDTPSRPGTFSIDVLPSRIIRIGLFRLPPEVCTRLLVSSYGSAEQAENLRFIGFSSSGSTWIPGGFSVANVNTQCAATQIQLYFWL